MALEVGTTPMDIDAIVSRLAEDFGRNLRDLSIHDPDTVVGRCDRRVLKALSRGLKAGEPVGYPTLNWIAGVDRDGCLETVYHLYSWKTNTYLQLHVVLAGIEEVDTVCDVWPAAEWLEREAWDMFGIRFNGHPDLRRILLKDDFVGHPLRKGYIDLPENHPHV